MVLLSTFVLKIIPHFINYATLGVKVAIDSYPCGYYNETRKEKQHVDRNSTARGEMRVKHIILETEDIRLKGYLNHTVAAEEFRKRLPMTLSCKRNDKEYCCSIARGVFEPNDLQVGWKNGDLLLWDGCFVVDFGGEDQSAEYGLTMVIGHTEEYEKLNNLKETIRLSIRVTETEGEI